MESTLYNSNITFMSRNNQYSIKKGCGLYVKKNKLRNGGKNYIFNWIVHVEDHI